MYKMLIIYLNTVLMFMLVGLLADGRYIKHLYHNLYMLKT